MDVHTSEIFRALEEVDSHASILKLTQHLGSVTRNVMRHELKYRGSYGVPYIQTDIPSATRE